MKKLSIGVLTMAAAAMMMFSAPEQALAATSCGISGQGFSCTAAGCESIGRTAPANRMFKYSNNSAACGNGCESGCSTFFDGSCASDCNSAFGSCASDCGSSCDGFNRLPSKNTVKVQMKPSMSFGCFSGSGC